MDNEQKNPEEQQQRSSLTDLVKSLRNSNRKLDNEVYGTNGTIDDETAHDIAVVKNTVNQITSKYNKNTGEDPVEFFAAVSNNEAGNINRGRKKNVKLDISKMLDVSQLSVADLFAQEQGRIQQYASYQLIYDNIPQMSQAVTTYVDNILSPDDFTKKIFNIYYKNTIVNDTEAEVNSNTSYYDVIENVKKLNEKYDFEGKAQTILTESLKLGDCFVLCLPIRNEIAKLMVANENAGFFNEEAQISNSDIYLTEEEWKECFNLDSSKLNEITDKKEFAIKSNNLNEEKNAISNEIANMINKNVIFTSDPNVLIEDNITMMQDFSSLHKNDIDENMINNVFGNNKNTNKKPSDTIDPKKIKVTGSVVKIIKPEKIIKLQLDDVVYGYLYVEGLSQAPDTLTTGNYSFTNNIFTQFNSNQSDDPTILNGKYRLITDVFVRNLSKRINKKFINKNPQFKDLIYNLLKQDYILNKQIRITYLSPNEVVHFGIGDDEYYDSIFKKIMFAAKLYLAVLTSQVMLRLVRAPDKRK